MRDPGLPLGGPAAERLAGFATRRLRREPVSRILGRREFWGLSLAVTPDVLDPRADTEAVVEAVLHDLGPRRPAPLRVLDLGTGSGTLLCALLHACPRAFGIGIDVSAAACAVARDNLAALGLTGRGVAVRGSWGAAVRGPFDIVVANPPYVAHADLSQLPPEVAGYDPLLALDGGADGLDPYRAIVPDLPALLAPGGFAAFEGGWNQGAAIAGMLSQTGLVGVGLWRDLGGHDRVAFGRRSGQPGNWC